MMNVKALRELIDRCTEENANTVSSTFFNFSSIFERIIFVSDCFFG